MVRKTYQGDAIRHILREAERLAADGLTVNTAYQRLGIAVSTLYRWRLKHGAGKPTAKGRAS